MVGRPGWALRRVASGLALVLWLAALATGQQRVQLHGQVQWISGTQMVLMTDDGLSVAVDLLGVDQASYEGLTNGNWVTVVGEVARDRSRVIAREVRPDPPAGPTGPRF
jgi:hypothetical protein